MTTRKPKNPPATHLIQGVKAGGKWRIAVFSVRSQSVGACEHENVSTALTNALLKCADLERQRKGKKHGAEWAIQNDEEIQFRNMGEVTPKRKGKRHGNC